MNLERTVMKPSRNCLRSAAALVHGVVVLLLASFPLSAQADLLQRPEVKAAFQFLDRDFDRFVAELVTLTEIPAPSFKETVRARAMEAKFRELKLNNVHIDQEGNVIGERAGKGGGPLLVLAAHLDTVFPEGTDVHVRKEGTKYSAPGIGDDTHGLASLLAIIRALDSAHIVTRSDILFVADVGEEGLGNSRGIHYLLEKGEYHDRVKNFISIDGGDENGITNGGVASKRYRVTFKGPGGHSYGAFGLVSPSFAMGDAMARFSHSEVPQSSWPRHANLANSKALWCAQARSMCPISATSSAKINIFICCTKCMGRLAKRRPRISPRAPSRASTCLAVLS